MLNKFASLLLLPLLFLACTGPKDSATAQADMHTDADADAVNASAADGDWVDLFNGEDLSGWHKYGGDDIGSAWKVEDGAIYLDVTDKDDWQANNGGDIITDESYANYEMELDWKIGECGNSGVIYNVQETDEYDYPWKTGPEMQILDNTCHPDAKNETHRAGDLYDMVAVKKRKRAARRAVEHGKTGRNRR